MRRTRSSDEVGLRWMRWFLVGGWRYRLECLQTLYETMTWDGGTEIQLSSDNDRISNWRTTEGHIS
jgi:hypothetical protein